MSDDKLSYFLEAIESGDLHEVRRQLGKNQKIYDIKAYADEVFTPISQAVTSCVKDGVFKCEGSSGEILSLLLEKKILLNEYDDGISTPVSIATSLGSIEAIKFLVGHGSDINIGEWPAITSAAQNNHVECVKYLLENGAKLNLPSY